MSAKPVFPSICQIYQGWPPGGKTGTNIPCRLVPMTWLWHGRPYVGAVNSPTHWIDLECGHTNLPGALRQSLDDDPRGYVFDGSLAEVFGFCECNSPCYYVSLFKETRYLDTPDEYVRVYVMKVVDEAWGLEDPPCS